MNDESLEQAVKASKSYREVTLKLNLRGGSSWYAVKRRINELNLDVSHFLGRRANSGVTHKGGPEKFTVHNIHLVKRRVKGSQLAQFLVETGVEEKCVKCGQLPQWMERELKLNVDHIDGDGTNNALSNLRFLCPNCHSQTETFGFKGRTHTPESRALQSLKASKPRRKSYVTVAKLADASDRESDA